MVDGLGPLERFGVGVIVLNVRCDGSGKIIDADKTAAPDAFAGDLRKPALDQIEPRGTGGCEMHMEARMFFEPGFDGRMFVRRVVVDDQVKVEPSWGLAVHMAQKFEELLMAMATKTFADDGAFQHVERGEKCRGAMAHVVVSHGAATSSFHGQARLSAIQGLNLRFLIHTEDQRFVRGIEIEADDIGEFFDKLLVARKFEGAYAVRLQAVALPDAGDRHVTEFEMAGQGAGTPLGGIDWLDLEGSIDNLADRLLI